MLRASASSPTRGAEGGTSRSRAARDLLLEPAEDGLQVGHVEVVALVLEPVDEVLARRLRSVALVGYVVDVQALLAPAERILGEGDASSHRESCVSGTCVVG